MIRSPHPPQNYYAASLEAFAQLDGVFKPTGGSEPAYSLSSGSSYHQPGGTILTAAGVAEGQQDIWITGYLDGACPVGAPTCTDATGGFPGKVTYSHLSKRVKVAESPGFGKSIFRYAPGSPSAREFQNLCEELTKRLNLPETVTDSNWA